MRAYRQVPPSEAPTDCPLGWFTKFDELKLVLVRSGGAEAKEKPNRTPALRQQCDAPQSVQRAHMQHRAHRATRGPRPSAANVGRSDSSREQLSRAPRTTCGGSIDQTAVQRSAAQAYDGMPSTPAARHACRGPHARQHTPMVRAAAGQRGSGAGVTAAVRCIARDHGRAELRLLAAGPPAPAQPAAACLGACLGAHRHRTHLHARARTRTCIRSPPQLGPA
jgi:hypothetical protein